MTPNNFEFTGVCY